MVSDLHVVSESSMTTKEENCFESELTWIDSKHQLGCLAQGKVKRFALNTITLNIRGDKTTYIRTELGKSRTAIVF